MPDQNQVKYVPAGTAPMYFGPGDRVSFLVTGSVADLAGNKEVDLRRFSSCWLSRPIARPGVHSHRFLCFESGHRGNAPELVGNILRSIVPLTGETFDEARS